MLAGDRPPLNVHEELSDRREYYLWPIADVKKGGQGISYLALIQRHLFQERLKSRVGTDSVK